MKRKLLFAAALFALFATQAQAAKLYISEYANVGQLGGYPNTAPVGQESSRDQAPVDFSGGAASSAPFQASTRIVRVICDASCSVVFGTSPQTATTSNKLLPAGSAEYFGVIQGQIVSVISNP